jgi:hypothetical protein
MPVPNYQTLMLPLLKLASDRELHTLCLDGRRVNMAVVNIAAVMINGAVLT